jgi:hypothetical protein
MGAGGQGGLPPQLQGMMEKFQQANPNFQAQTQPMRDQFQQNNPNFQEQTQPMRDQFARRNPAWGRQESPQMQVGAPQSDYRPPGMGPAQDSRNGLESQYMNAEYSPPQLGLSDKHVAPSPVQTGAPSRMPQVGGPTQGAYRGMGMEYSPKHRGISDMPTPPSMTGAMSPMSPGSPNQRGLGSFNSPSGLMNKFGGGSNGRW